MGTDRSPAHYRSFATRFAYRHPVWAAVITQVNFWIVVNALLVAINHLVLQAVSVTYTTIVPPPLLPVLGLSTLTGIFYGTALAFIDMGLDRRLGMGASMGRRILLKAALYTIAFVVISSLTLLAFNLLMADWFARLGMAMTPEATFRWGLTFVPTTLAGNFLISFIKQVNRSFGPGLLVSLLLGRYRKPLHERRIFMFMDLRSSTRHAEELGPERYSSMVRDLFHDVDSAVPTYGAEIYQYVGDEVVFTWNADDTPDKERCLHFHFAICDAITQRAEHYLATYGRVPEFKAGLHLGEVVAVEIGEIKREIAYHGDTINTAARIQSMCNEMGRALIISENLLAACTMTEILPLRTIELGSVLLKGKQQHVAIHAVERSAENMELLHDHPSTIAEV